MSQDFLVSSALIVREPHISRILSGEKVWELRGSKTHKRGVVGLIRQGSSLVVGVVSIVDVLPWQSDQQLLDNIDKHCVPRARIPTGEIGKWRYPWVLEGARQLPEPVPYEHRAGAVIWVTLEPEVADAVSSQVSDNFDSPVPRDPPASITTLNRHSSSPGRPEPPVTDLMVPVARDGRWFGPELARNRGMYQIGAKGEERRIAGFEQALAELEQMDVARWRRPNERGNWGIVSAIEWRCLGELDRRTRESNDY